MADHAMCAGRRPADSAPPLKLCDDCRRRTARAEPIQTYIEPPVRRVAGTTRYVCVMRLGPVGVSDAA